jgi:uncharacterized membrane protein
MTLDGRNVTQDACDTDEVMSEIRPAANSFIASKTLAWVLIIGGTLGWIGAFLLTLERLHVAENPDAVLGCDVASFISCKSVMLSWQAKLFGFPNPLIGLGAFVAPLVVGVAVLAGARFAAWFWQIFTGGLFLGFVFVLWLFDQAVFDIGALCPYCMVAWLGMIPMFWTVFLFGAREGFIWVPTRTIRFFVSAYDWSWLFSLATILGLAAVIAVKFWSLWLDFFGV